MLDAAESIYGPALIGCIVTALSEFCGTYSIIAPQKQASKSSLRLLDTVHYVTVTGSVYYYLIVYRNTQTPGSATLWTDGVVIMISHISNTITRCVMLSKIYQRSMALRSERPKRSTSGVTGESQMYRQKCAEASYYQGTIAATAGGFGVFYGAVSTTVSPVEAPRAAQWVLYAGLTCEATTDLAIAVTLCIYFARLRSAVETSHPLMDRLILYTVCAGMFPCAIALTSLISVSYTFVPIDAVLKTTPLRRILPAAKLETAEKILRAMTDETSLDVCLSRAGTYVSSLDRLRRPSEHYSIDEAILLSLKSRGLRQFISGVSSKLKTRTATTSVSRLSLLCSDVFTSSYDGCARGFLRCPRTVTECNLSPLDLIVQLFCYDAEDPQAV
ncbi:hypothetical protein NM688_g2148 [Phlebia brevispora]|uniref:Uncharacterized protein n=1 Tax=Phlebia brevispora TaxID=194682 RepID=A0ACC1TA39_9APHY|nr:hypothetical protein NM688_g2148 [Phlebia brevispora]